MENQLVQHSHLHNSIWLNNEVAITTFKNKTLPEKVLANMLVKRFNSYDDLINRINQLDADNESLYKDLTSYESTIVRLRIGIVAIFFLSVVFITILIQSK